MSEAAPAEQPPAEAAPPLPAAAAGDAPEPAVLGSTAAAPWLCGGPPAPLWSIPGRAPGRFPWRAPGDVDRAGAGAASRRLYPAPALHEAARAGDAAALESLLDSGEAGVDDVDGGGHCALQHAAGFDQAGCVRALLRRGAALEQRDALGLAPVDWALRARADGCVALLVEAATARGLGAAPGAGRDPRCAPLRTSCENHYGGRTDKELDAETRAWAEGVAAEADAADDRQRARRAERPNGAELVATLKLGRRAAALARA